MLRIPNEPLYQMLRDGRVSEFNDAVKNGAAPDLTNCDFRNCDLKGLNAEGLDLSGCYFRNCDLRGIDFRKTNLEGASFHGAQISGCYFPTNLSPEEITMSVVHGTRVRLLS
jgi:uncharacterized protein YjbI with pentapeptide repeats